MSTFKTFSPANAAEFLLKYKWLSSCVVDFFTKELYLKLETEFDSTIEINQIIKHIQKHDHTSINSSISNFINHCNRLKLSRDVVNSNSKEPPKLSNALAQGLNSKKQIEVRYLSSRLDSLCSNHGISKIIDMGSGQGYLDSCLAFQYGYNVVGVECKWHLTCGALKEASRISTSNKINKTGSINYINRFIEPNEKLGDIIGNDENDLNWMICGLHSCGDLSVACINQFVGGNAKILSVVCCCYNLISENCFPLSSQVKRTGIKLGAPELMLANQSTIRWDDSVIPVFRKHYYRALVQLIIKELKLLPEGDNIRVGKLSKTAFNQGFVHYCECSFKKLSIQYPFDSLNERTLKGYELKYGDKEKSVALFWTLRAMIGGVIESLILVDRGKYLEELGGINVDLQPIFDEFISPRNMLLVGIKI